MNSYNQRKRKDEMSLSSYNSVNSAIMYNMEIMIKMSFVIILISTAIMFLIVFKCPVLLNSKSNVTVYKGHINFRKEVPKCSQSAG